ncbi:guanine deaminase [Pelomyxa schiedti]|nr:guanine deaminase [Pelomyxa schiedti]
MASGGVAVTGFRGGLVHCGADGQLQIMPDAAIGIGANGKIAFVVPDASTYVPPTGVTLRQLSPTQFFVPGFIDGHIHAPQYSFVGLGSNLALLEWLNTYTFNYESKFSDMAFAKAVYTRIVQRTLKNGTTTASYFATIHLEASNLLVEIMNSLGQRGFVGKVNMDRKGESPDHYIEETASSLQNTRKFLEHFKTTASSLVSPIITPRFVISCTSDLMTGLAEIARENDAPIQTHISENRNEIKYTVSLYNEVAYAHIYDNHGLLTPKTILAHGIYLSDEELTLIAQKHSSVIHCPTSNFNLGSGCCPVKRLLSRGIKVGLGTDVSGGYHASMLGAMRDAITASQAVHFTQTQCSEASSHTSPNPPDTALTYIEAFYLATLGGAAALNMDNLVGNFVVGKAFDALLVDAAAANGPIDLFGFETLSDMFQKFFFSGDDRNIKEVYVSGTRVIG